MDFYYMNLSGPSRACMLTAKALGITLNKKVVNLLEKEQMKPEFIAINPQHCIPTLVDNGFALWESRAISTYLVSKYGKDDSLYPKEPKLRATVDRLLYFDMGTLSQRYGEYVYPVMHNIVDKPDPEKLEKVHEALGWLNGYLKGQDFAACNHITVADFFLIATVTTFLETGIDLSKYSNIMSWVERSKTQMVGYDTENAVGAKEMGAYAKAKFPQFVK